MFAIAYDTNMQKLTLYIFCKIISTFGGKYYDLTLKTSMLKCVHQLLSKIITYFIRLRNSRIYNTQPISHKDVKIFQHSLARRSRLDFALGPTFAPLLIFSSFAYGPTFASNLGFASFWQFINMVEILRLRLFLALIRMWHMHWDSGLALILFSCGSMGFYRK